MQTEPATTSRLQTVPLRGSCPLPGAAAAGPIRAFKVPVGVGGAVDVFVWLEGRELVVKELSSLVRPARGERRVLIDDIQDIELGPCAEEQLLILRSHGSDLRLQAPYGVMQSLVRELAEFAGLGALESPAARAGGSRPGFVGRVVGWLHGQ